MNSPVIKFQLLHPDAKLPTKATEGAACFDVVAVSRKIKDGYVHYGLGFATEIPEGWQAKCYARSSISNTDLMLCNGVGIIDADYRGEWGYRFRYTPRMEKSGFSWKGKNQNANEFNITMRESARYAKFYEVGERIGQIQFEPVPVVELLQVDSLSDTERGTGGFGSTGS